MMLMAYPRCVGSWVLRGLTSTVVAGASPGCRGYKKSKFGTPVHDDASHGADAMKTVATGLNLVTALSSSLSFGGRFGGGYEGWYDDGDCDVYSRFALSISSVRRSRCFGRA